MKLLEENEQLKTEKVDLEASLERGQAEFYKLGYVDQFLGMPSDYAFSQLYLDLFSISPEDLLQFSFESAMDRAVKMNAVEVGSAKGDEVPAGPVVDKAAQAGAAEDEVQDVPAEVGGSTSGGAEAE